MSDHVLGDGHRQVVLAVVDEEAEADEVGQDGRRARLCPDRWRRLGLARLGLDYGEAAGGMSMLVMRWKGAGCFGASRGNETDGRTGRCEDLYSANGLVSQMHSTRRGWIGLELNGPFQMERFSSARVGCMAAQSWVCAIACGSRHGSFNVAGSKSRDAAPRRRKFSTANFSTDMCRNSAAVVQVQPL